jgi:hypothetical protein
VGGFDLLNRVRDQGTEAVTLFLSDASSQILDFDQPLADEDHESDIGFSSNPGVAHKLGIEG